MHKRNNIGAVVAEIARWLAGQVAECPAAGTALVPLVWYCRTAGSDTCTRLGRKSARDIAALVMHMADTYHTAAANDPMLRAEVQWCRAAVSRMLDTLVFDTLAIWEIMTVWPAPIQTDPETYRLIAALAMRCAWIATSSSWQQLTALVAELANGGNSEG